MELFSATVALFSPAAARWNTEVLLYIRIATARNAEVRDIRPEVRDIRADHHGGVVALADHYGGVVALADREEHVAITEEIK